MQDSKEKELLYNPLQRQPCLRKWKSSEMYKDLLYADLVVCPTHYLKDFALKYTGANSHRNRRSLVRKIKYLQPRKEHLLASSMVRVRKQYSISPPRIARPLNRTNINKPINYTILTSGKYIGIIKKFVSTIKINQKEQSLNLLHGTLMISLNN